ncbi:MAG TPA: NAD-dependent dehydratase [Elusimicrobiota bacterium]|nr:NAD-dependent dehydratase [Elusimicrobiota bacterium]
MKGLAAAVAGATGLVGGLVLRRLLDDPEVERVIAPTRRPLPPHPKLSNPILAGGGWPALAPLDEAYACLGTTRAAAGSDEAFRAVDLGLTLAFARAAKAAGARRFGLVSSIGARARSRFLYLRTKGEAEAAVSGLGFESVAVVRPSYLLGERSRARPAEALALAAFRLAAPVLRGPLRRWRAVRAEDVAASLVAALRGRVPGTLILESGALRAP